MEERFVRLEETTAEVERQRDEAVSDLNALRQSMAVSNGQLEEMAAAHELAIAQMRSRCEELQSELAERDGLLKSANAALQQTTLQLQSSAADSDGKLRSAMEMASSLRSLLDQKEAALRTSHSREKRQAEAIASSTARPRGCRRSWWR